MSIDVNKMLLEKYPEAKELWTTNKANTLFIVKLGDEWIQERLVNGKLETIGNKGK